MLEFENNVGEVEFFVADLSKLTCKTRMEEIETIFCSPTWVHQKTTMDSKTIKYYQKVPISEIERKTLYTTVNNNLLVNVRTITISKICIEVKRTKKGMNVNNMLPCMLLEEFPHSIQILEINSEKKGKTGAIMSGNIYCISKKHIQAIIKSMTEAMKAMKNSFSYLSWWQKQSLRTLEKAHELLFDSNQKFENLNFEQFGNQYSSLICHLNAIDEEFYPALRVAQENIRTRYGRRIIAIEMIRKNDNQQGYLVDKKFVYQNKTEEAGALENYIVPEIDQEFLLTFPLYVDIMLGTHSMCVSSNNDEGAMKMEKSLFEISNRMVAKNQIMISVLQKLTKFKRNIQNNSQNIVALVNLEREKMKTKGMTENEIKDRLREKGFTEEVINGTPNSLDDEEEESSEEIFPTRRKKKVGKTNVPGGLKRRRKSSKKNKKGTQKPPAKKVKRSLRFNAYRPARTGNEKKRREYKKEAESKQFENLNFLQRMNKTDMDAEKKEKKMMEQIDKDAEDLVLLLNLEFNKILTNDMKEKQQTQKFWE